MKKVRMILAVVALFTATVGVFATQIVVDTYHRPDGMGDDCGLSATPLCEQAVGIQCTSSLEGGSIDPIFYKINGEGDCLVFEYDNTK